MGLETKNKETEEKNTNTFEELKEEIVQVENRVTTKLLKEIEPSLNVMKDDIQNAVGVDIRRIVQEEMALEKLKENKEREDAENKEEGPENIKNTKNQKNNKTTKSKKN